MKKSTRLLTFVSSAAMLLAAIPASIFIVKAFTKPAEFSQEIKPTKPGKGETVSFLPKAVSDFYNLNDLATTYTTQINKISELTPYTQELANWVNYDNNEAVLLPLFEKYDLYRPVNNTLAWESSLNASSYKVIISQDKDFKRIEREYTVDGNKNSVTFENPYTGVKYYWQVIATLYNESQVYSDVFNFNVEALPRTLNIPGVSNTRDLGGVTNESGQTIKQGLLYRSMKLEHATEKGVNELKNNLGIKTDLDLRSVGEGTENPLGFAKYYHHPAPYAYGENTGIESAIENINGFNSLVGSFGLAVKQLADPNNYPVIFHCSVGRDRTGWMAMCLDYLCGMSDEVVLKEFSLSLFSTSGALNKGNIELYKRFIKIRDYISTTYEGSNMSEKMEDYLVKNTTVTHDDCDNIRDILFGNTAVDFEAGSENQNNYQDYVRVTFRKYGEENVVKLLAKDSLIENPNVQGNGAWYHNGDLWDFANDVASEDMYLDYLEPQDNKVVIHFSGLQKDDEILSIPSGTNLTFENYEVEGYTFKVYDSDFNLITSASINDDAIFNIVYKNNTGYKPKTNPRIIVLAGQSNAAGVGHYPYLSLTLPQSKLDEYAQGFDNVLMSGWCQGTTMSDFRPVYMDEDYGTVGNSTFGFEVSLAERLSKVYEDETTYIVKYALGACSLGYDFISPSSEETTVANSVTPGEERGYLYNGMIKSVREAIKMVQERENAYPIIDAFMWMQGESDASFPLATEKYTEVFNNLVKDFKNEFKSNIGPKFAVYDAGISQFENWLYGEEINDYKRARADANNVYLDTRARGLTTFYEPIDGVDQAHYDSACYIDLGHYFADEYIAHRDPTYVAPKLEIISDDVLQLSLLDGNVTLNVSSKFNGTTIDSSYSFFTQDKNIFTVDASGVVTPKAIGTANLKIHSYYNGEVSTKQIEVRVHANHLADEPLLSFKDEAKIHYSGRNVIENNRVLFINTLSGFETTFVGKELYADLRTIKYVLYGQAIKIRVYVDDDTTGYEVEVPTTKTAIKLCEFNEVGQHKIKVQKINYEHRGYIEMTRLYGASSFVESVDTRKKVLIYGDSITVGCGINGRGSTDSRDNEDGTKTYAAQLVNKYNLNAQVVAITGISLGARQFRRKTMSQIYDDYSYTWANAYNFAEFVPDLILINLGSNDTSALSEITNQYGETLSYDDVSNGAFNMLNGLRKSYKNSNILFCYGMMGFVQEIEDAYNSALNKFTSLVSNEYLTKQGFMKFELSQTSATYGGHPTPNCHNKAFEQLEKYNLVKVALGIE